MAKTVTPKVKANPRGARVLAIARTMPKMSAAQSGRMYELIEKKKRQRLTKTEDREVRDLLDLVDRQSYWNLAEAIEVEARASAQPRKTRKTG